MSPAKQTVRDLRRNNRQSVLRCLYFDGPMSRLEASQRSGLSPATVTNVVAELLHEGIVVESGFEDSEGGRPRAILAMNPDYGSFVGVDLGETHIRAGLYDLTLRKLASATQPVPPQESQPEQVVRRIVDSLQTLLSGPGLRRDRVLGIGIGAPGVVERSGGVSVFAPNWGWHNVPLLAMLREHLHLPIYLDNGAKAMALAELWLGAGKGVGSLAALIIGTGVGAGIIAGGALYRGATNSAGEWGHTLVELDGRPCRCGSHGCLEAYVGAPGIIQRLREQDPQNPLLRDTHQMATIQAIFDAARRGDPAATQVLQDTIHYLGAGIANLINLFNPERIVLGGWVGVQLGEPVLSELGQVVERYALKQPLTAVSIDLCHLGEDAISVGAAALVLEDFVRADLGARRLTGRTEPTRYQKRSSPETGAQTDDPQPKAVS